MKLEVNGWFKMADEDIFNEGCKIDDAVYCNGREEFSAENQEDLIFKLMQFTGADDKESVLINSCDEKGRIDIQVMETIDSEAATRSDVEKWKQGRQRLWLACYSFHVYEVERKAATLKEGA